MAEEKDIDPLSGVDTTGHEWDGIKELNNPMPRWWLWTFYGTVIWALIYTIAFPAWPMIGQATQGLLGYDSRREVAEDIAAAAAAKQLYRDQIGGMELAEIATDPELLRFAQVSGAATFRTYCAQCHGAGAAGNPGFPNLLDDDWIWGGTPEAIHLTVTHGIRAPEDPDSRIGDMPAFGRDQLLDGEQMAAVTEYVLSLSGQDHDAALAETGATVFAENCVSCHGEDGTGLAELGGPDLTDAIWLYPDGRQGILETLASGRRGMMPAWSERLSPEQIKEVALYVHSLGGGE
ncbi:MAG TPA: cytochrome-c oxidase, cbb3-type subunit III [Paracoccaceae bacterium]|nr:cytochrome-c oxidase, cbb3-type subunit III [Paracoccaceae bacterium]